MRAIFREAVLQACGLPPFGLSLYRSDLVGQRSGGQWLNQPLADTALARPKAGRSVSTSSHEGMPAKGEKHWHCVHWWARQDLNLGPMDYESTALTAELRAREM